MPCNDNTRLYILTLGGDHKDLRGDRQDRDRADNARRRGRPVRSHPRRRRGLRGQRYQRRGKDTQFRSAHFGRLDIFQLVTSKCGK